MSRSPSSDWVVRKMSDLGAIVGGGTPASENSELWGGDIFWATPSEVVKTKSRYIRTTERKLSNQGLHASSAKVHPVDTLLLTTRASIGYCAINKSPMATNQGFQSLRPNEHLDTEFGYYLLTHNRSKFQKLASGSTFLEISATEIRNITFPIPPLAEQKKIAEILSSVDEVIEKTESEISKLEDLKTATLTELLTKGIGHTEFKDSEIGRIPKSWEVNNLTTLCRPKQWKTISQTDLTSTGFPVFGANGYIGYYHTYNHEQEVLAITCRGATCGNVNMLPPKVYVTGNSMCLDDIVPTMNIHFLHFYLERRGLRDVITGSAQPQITADGLSKVAVVQPPRAEQDAIAACILGIDQALSALGRKHKNICDLRAALMQDLLTGKVRVKVN